MDDREPTIRSRELGEGLRQAMEQAGMNGKMTALALGWSQTRISRVLKGRRGINELDVASFLGACRVTDPERARLLALCEEQDKQGWWQQHGKRLPNQLVTLIEYETKATYIGDFQAIVMPGLLQTDEYARALFVEAGCIPESEIGERVAARLARQSLLGAGTTDFLFYIHEFVLRLPVGGRDVMSDQLHALLRLIVRPRISIRVVPMAIGAHAGVAGSFTSMVIPDFRTIVYLESETSSLFLEKPVEAGAYQDILAKLDATALSVQDSREVIARLAIELYSSGEDAHD